MIGFLSDVGMVRSLNEDFVCYHENGDFNIYVVADGMGGHNAGEVASKMAAEGIVDFVKKYFNKEWSRDYCANCSNCLKNDELRDFTREAQIILSTVYRTREAYGISVLIDILRGIKGPKIIKNRLDNVTTFGLMKEYSTSFIRGLIKEMISDEFVSLKEGTYSMLKLTQKSMDVLLKGKKVILLVKEEETAINKELFNIVKNWRRERAYKDGIKPYIIFSDATLIEIVNKLPKSKEELMDIRGVGEKKVERYGEEILKIISKEL